MGRRLGLGFAITFFVVCLGLVLYPLFAVHKGKGQRIPCLSNAKRSATALLMYASDYDYKLPAASRWMDAALPYAQNKEFFRCDSVPLSTAYGRGFLDRLGQRALDEDTDSQRLMVIESTDLGWNAHGDLALLPLQGRHRENLYTVSYADGHGRLLPRQEVEEAYNRTPSSPSRSQAHWVR